MTGGDDEDELADQLRALIRAESTPSHIRLGAIKQLRLLERGRPPLKVIPEPRGGSTRVPPGTPLAEDGQPADPLAELDAFDAAR